MTENEKLDLEAKRLRIENLDAHEDSRRKMAWISLSAMIMYPPAMILGSYLGLDLKVAAEIGPAYFIAVAGLVSAFFGASAYSSAKR